MWRPRGIVARARTVEPPLEDHRRGGGVWSVAPPGALRNRHALFRLARAQTLVHEMDRKAGLAPERGREPLHPAELGTPFLPFEAEGSADHDRLGILLPRGLRDRDRGIAHARDAERAKRCREHPARIAPGEPDPAEAEVHA